MRLARVYFYLIFISLFASCADPCLDVQCTNNSICQDGLCACDVGYEGDDCSVEARAKYFKTYTYTVIEEMCGSNFNETSSVQATLIVSSAPEVLDLTIQDGNRSFVVRLDDNQFEGSSFTETGIDGNKTITPSGSFFNNKLFLTYNTVEQVNGSTISCVVEIEAK